MQYANGLNFDIGYARMYSPRMTIGDRLDKAMKDAKIASQSSLARASGVPQATISRILKGGGKRGPESDTVRKLAEACNVRFDWLNEGIGELNRTSRPSVPHAVESAPPADREATVDEIVELIAAYNAANPADRRTVMKSAKLAAKRASVKRSERAGD